MKKFILSSMSLLLAAFAISAGNIVARTTSTYYGEQANPVGPNPCSGPTTRVCATITTEIVEESGNYYTVYETTYNEAGTVTNTTSRTTSASPDEVIAEIIANAPDNAVVSTAEEQYATPAP